MAFAELDFCRKRGQDPNKPYSARLLMRVSPDVHRDLMYAAKLNGQSVNTFINDVLKDATRT